MKATVIIPTRNEQNNIAKLLSCFQFQIESREVEVLVVDDSDDRTAEIASWFGATIIQGRRLGLGAAILDGIKSAQGEFIAVMDADLSHDPDSLVDLFSAVEYGGADLAVGSRYTRDGEIVNWNFTRRLASRFACLLGIGLTPVRDLTSGFFAFRRELITGVDLKPGSWKILLEVIVKAKPIRVVEVPITFTDRTQGESKFNRVEVGRYLRHLIDLYLFKYSRFLKFGIVGGIGALITFGLTWILTEGFGLFYMVSLILAVAVATISNFTLNSFWTFAVADPDDPSYEWKAYHAGSFFQKYWKRAIARKVYEMNPDRDGLTLDVGCGSSPLSSYYHEVDAVDCNAEKLKYLANRVGHVKPLNPGQPFSPNGRKYDTILCIEVMEHLENPEELFSRFMVATEGEARLVIATPDYSRPLWKIAEKFTPYQEDHIYRFTRKTLEAMAARYKFVAVNYKYVAGCDLVETFIRQP